jgi:hypothetical protein
MPRAKLSSGSETNDTCSSHSTGLKEQSLINSNQQWGLFISKCFTFFLLFLIESIMQIRVNQCHWMRVTGPHEGVLNGTPEPVCSLNVVPRYEEVLGYYKSPHNAAPSPTGVCFYQKLRVIIDVWTIIRLALYSLYGHTVMHFSLRTG